MAEGQENKYNKIGAAWIGEFGINGVIEFGDEKIRFYFFENKKKKTDKQPDYNILVKNPNYDGATNPPKNSAPEKPKDDLPF